MEAKTCCYALSYYFPQFVRTATLVAALRQIESITVYEAINKSRGWGRYFQTLLQLLFIRLRYNPDFYILGFRGYELFWPVRLIAWGKTLIFDHMMSPYDSLINEKRRLRQGSLISKIVYRYEKNLLRCADLVLTDTPMHQSYFAELFGLNPNKIHPLHVAADETLFAPCAKHYLPHSLSKPFEVFFYGSFLPLHGTDIILRAAALLKSQPVHFTLIGGGRQNLKVFKALHAELGLTNITHIPWVEYYEIPHLACKADLCLGGPFGNTGQARRVITGKTYQFLALGQPTVVGLIEPNEYFIHQKNCLLVSQGNPEALARAIEWAIQHRSQLPEIGRKGYELYKQDFSVTCLTERLKIILRNAILST
jgi:glycosyltransferase involved in cell wall biosynthesis